MLKHCIILLTILIAFQLYNAENSNLTSLEIKNQRAIDVGGSTKNYFITLADGNEYYFSVGNWKTWHDASSFCNWIGMKLINLNTVEKDAMVQLYMDEIVSESYLFWTAGKNVGNNFVWSGVGEIFSHSSWAEGQPNGYLNSDGVCVQLDGNNHLLEMWYDVSCSLNCLFICEY